MFLLLRRKLLRHRFIAIHCLDRDASAYGQRLVFYVGGLVIVEIEICVRGHNHVMPQFGSLDASGLANP